MTKLLTALLLVAVSLPAAADLNCSEKGNLAFNMAIEYDENIQFQTMNHRTLNTARANQEMMAIWTKRNIEELQARDTGGKATMAIKKLIDTVYKNAGTVNAVAISETITNACKKGEL